MRFLNASISIRVFTLKKGAMPIPELTRGCIIGDLVVLYIFASEVAQEDREEQVSHSFDNIITLLARWFKLA